MNAEQFKRANEIANRIKYLAERRDALQTIREGGVLHLEIKTYSQNSRVHTVFKLDDNVNHNNAIEHQPTSIPVLLDAFIQTSIAVYQREIDQLEKEFNAL